MKQDYKQKIKTLKELLKLVNEDYFEPFFKERKKLYPYKKITYKEFKFGVQEFLECRVIELETDKNY
jgi:hypothetical protein